jgi:hypothetical protein
MNPETEISDLLSCLLPSTRMRIWLNKVFEAKAAKGEPFPERDVLWLAFVERACSDLPSDIDNIAPEQWAWIESKIFANRPKGIQADFQPALINLASEKVVAY